MPDTSWNEEYTTGVQAVDEQHRNLLDVIRKLKVTLQRGRGPSQVNWILNDLVGCTQEHFAAEEALLKAAAYPQLREHQASHRRLLQTIERFQYEYNAADGRVSAEMDAFLDQGMLAHILLEDKPYAAYLAGAATTVPIA